MKAKSFALVVLLIVLNVFRGNAQNLRYEGAWTNLTFGSTGKARLDVTIDGANATLNFDLDGFVFGASDPPLITVPGVISNGILHLDSKGIVTYGDVSGTVDLVTGDTLIDVINVPNPNIKHVQLTGTVGQNLDLQYTVDFPGSSGPTNPAKGVLVAALVPALQITSVQAQNGELVVSWTGGNPPFQIQTSPRLAPTTWQNSGATTSDRTAHVPLGNATRLFVRVFGQ